MYIAIPGLENRTYVERYAWFSDPCIPTIVNTSLWNTPDCFSSGDNLTLAGLTYYGLTSKEILLYIKYKNIV
jgi:hypothetical protein